MVRRVPWHCCLSNIYSNSHRLKKTIQNMALDVIVNTPCHELGGDGGCSPGMAVISRKLATSRTIFSENLPSLTHFREKTTL